MGAVGSNTAFCLEDHPTDQNWIETIRPSNQPSPRVGPHHTAAPSQPETSQSATICGRRHTWHGWEDYKNQNLKPLRTCQICQRPSTGRERKKPLRSTTRDTSTNWLASWWTQAAARLATARTARHARFSELRTILYVSLGFNVRENSSMFV